MCGSLFPILPSIRREDFCVRWDFSRCRGREAPCEASVVPVAGASGVVYPSGHPRFVCPACVQAGFRRSTERVLGRLVPVATINLGACQLFPAVLNRSSLSDGLFTRVQAQPRGLNIAGFYPQVILFERMLPAFSPTCCPQSTSLTRRVRDCDTLIAFVNALRHFVSVPKKNQLPSGLSPRGNVVKIAGWVATTCECIARGAGW